MIKHTDKTETDKLLNSAVDKGAPVLEQSMVSGLEKKGDQPSIKELLEKNLKWSQIIYEQNRKINNKLMWSAIGSWFRILLIAVPLILAVWFLPPIIQGLQSTYGSLLGGGTTVNKTNSTSIDQLLKMLPLDQAKQEQLKALLK